MIQQAFSQQLNLPANRVNVQLTSTRRRDSSSSFNATVAVTVPANEAERFTALLRSNSFIESVLRLLQLQVPQVQAVTVVTPSTPPQSSKDSGGSSDNTIAIAIGASVVGVVVVAGIIFAITRRRKSAAPYTPERSAGLPELSFTNPMYGENANANDAAAIVFSRGFASGDLGISNPIYDDNVTENASSTDNPYSEVHPVGAPQSANNSAYFDVSPAPQQANGWQTQGGDYSVGESEDFHEPSFLDNGKRVR